MPNIVREGQKMGNIESWCINKSQQLYHITSYDVNKEMKHRDAWEGGKVGRGGGGEAKYSLKSLRIRSLRNCGLIWHYDPASSGCQQLMETDTACTKFNDIL